VLIEILFCSRKHSIKQFHLALNLNVKKSHNQVFLDQMGQVVSWTALVELISSYCLEGRTILLVMSDTLVGRGLLLKSTSTLVDATQIAASLSTKNKDHKCEPGMHSSKTGEPMHLGMKTRIGANDESGLMYTVHGTAGNINDVVKGNSLLHDEDVLAFGDAGYQGIEMRPETNAEVTWSIVIRPGQSKALNKEDVADALLDKSEKIKDDIRTKVDHTFRLIKR
jgi:IS5 family transposase